VIASVVSHQREPASWPRPPASSQPQGRCFCRERGKNKKKKKNPPHGCQVIELSSFVRLVDFLGCLLCVGDVELVTFALAPETWQTALPLTPYTTHAFNCGAVDSARAPASGPVAWAAAPDEGQGRWRWSRREKMATLCPQRAASLFVGVGRQGCRAFSFLGPTGTLSSCLMRHLPGHGSFALCR